MTAGATRTNKSITEAPKGSIAIIELNGPMMKADQDCGPAGTATIAEWIKQADANPNIDGIILKVDSPGGTVDGTEALGRTIKSTRKPIVGFVDGLAASAGYWAVSNCHEIIANGKTAEVGSIGVMCSFADVKPVLEKAGVKFHEAYASASTEKNRSYRDALAGDYSKLTEELDALNSIFQSTVRGNRPNAKEAVFAGATYLANEAKKMGLIDRIGTLDDAIQAVKQKSQSKMNKNKALTSFPLLCAVLGFADGFEMDTDESGAFFNQEDLQAIEARLSTDAEVASAHSQATTKVSELQTQLNTANQLVTGLTTERDNWKQKAEGYAQQRAHNGHQAGATAQTEAAAAAQETKRKYVPDGTEKIAEKYGMDTSNW